MLDLLGLLVPLALLALLAPSGLLDRLEQQVLKVSQEMLERRVQQEQRDLLERQALWVSQEPEVLMEPLEP